MVGMSLWPKLAWGFNGNVPLENSHYVHSTWSSTHVNMDVMTMVMGISTL